MKNKINMNNKKLNIVFISPGQYPNGGAASNRHMDYAKGLVELGNQVSFILINPQKDKAFHSLSGKVKFLNINSLVNNKKEFIINKFKNKYTKECVKSLKKINLDKKINVVILLDTNVRNLKSLINAAKKLKIKVFHERTEYPFIVEKKGILGKIHNKIYELYILPKFDGIYVISKALKKYINIVTKNNCPVKIINMMVDPSRFNEIASKNKDENPYIAYCGTMDGDKDGVGILIMAFGKAKELYPTLSNVNLKLIGDVSNIKLFNKLKQTAKESNCLDSIIFTGKVKRDEIPTLLSNAKTLALARPSNKQAEGGFPTKLGEYLATGNPVIITRVGEIQNFLIDKENAFISKPNDVYNFAEKIGEVFNEYPKAEKVGQNGRMLINTVFNYKVQAKYLQEFISE